MCAEAEKDVVDIFIALAEVDLNAENRAREEGCEDTEDGAGDSDRSDEVDGDEDMESEDIVMVNGIFLNSWNELSMVRRSESDC